jgi:hypothetical protein
VWINKRCFREITGITNTTLEEMYARADSDRDGAISWPEVAAFQRKLVREYRYTENTTALRPDQFIAKGGGDCEDFALVTAGLMRFWNWQPYIAGFGPDGPGYGHAICMAYSQRIPAGYTYYTIRGHTTEYGSPIKPGKYIPVDYDHIGSTSDAMGGNWRLWNMYVPEKIYGKWM